jgi:hypothetical protein
MTLLLGHFLGIAGLAARLKPYPYASLVVEFPPNVCGLSSGLKHRKPVPGRRVVCLGLRLTSPLGQHQMV